VAVAHRGPLRAAQRLRAFLGSLRRWNAAREGECPVGVKSCPDGPERLLSLYPQDRTSPTGLVMSVWCQQWVIPARLRFVEPQATYSDPHVTRFASVPSSLSRLRAAVTARPPFVVV